MITRLIFISNCQVFYTTNSSLLLQLDNLVAGGQLFNLTTEQVNRTCHLFSKLDLRSVPFLRAFLWTPPGRLKERQGYPIQKRPAREKPSLSEWTISPRLCKGSKHWNWSFWIKGFCDLLEAASWCHKWWWQVLTFQHSKPVPGGCQQGALLRNFKIRIFFKTWIMLLLIMKDSMKTLFFSLEWQPVWAGELPLGFSWELLRFANLIFVANLMSTMTFVVNLISDMFFVANLISTMIFVGNLISTMIFWQVWLYFLFFVKSFTYFLLIYIYISFFHVFGGC